MLSIYIKGVGLGHHFKTEQDKLNYMYYNNCYVFFDLFKNNIKYTFKGA